MLLFRSEEHVDRWAERTGNPKGYILTIDQLWGLTSVWQGGRMDRDWQRRTAEEAEALFESLGLTGEFWKLT